MNTKVNIVSVDMMRESQPVGSGILPFMLRDDGHGTKELLFVMAQEDFSYGWNQSGCWSGFEGGTLEGEDDAATAAREFVEESLYSIPLFGSVDPAYIADRLRQGEHCMKVYIRSENQRNVHTTYVVETPWNDSVIAEFYTVRRCLERINNMYRGRVGKTGWGSEVDVPVTMGDMSLSCVPTHLRKHPSFVAMGGAGAIDRDKFAAMLEKRRIQLCSYHDLHHYVYRAERKSSAKFRLRYRFVPLIKTVLERIPRCCPSVAFILRHGLAHRTAEKVPECNRPAMSPAATVWQTRCKSDWDDPAVAAGGGAAGKNTSDGEHCAPSAERDAGCAK